MTTSIDPVTYYFYCDNCKENKSRVAGLQVTITRADVGIPTGDCPDCGGKLTSLELNSSS